MRRASSNSSCVHSTTGTRILKPDKILVDATSNIKVTNFGLSTLTLTAQQAAQLYIVYRMSMFITPEMFLWCPLPARGRLLALQSQGHHLVPHDPPLVTTYHFSYWFSTGLTNLVYCILFPDLARRIAIYRRRSRKIFGSRRASRRSNRATISKIFMTLIITTSQQMMYTVRGFGIPDVMHVHTSVSAVSLTTLESVCSAAIKA